MLAAVDPIGVRTRRATRSTSGAPPLLLFHGLADHGGCWVAAVAAFHDRAVLATDAPGHGVTPLPAGDDPVPVVQGRHAAALLDALGTGPVDVCGHSMGANAALLFAADRPDLVRRVVLEDPPWWVSARNQVDRDQAVADLTMWTASFRSVDGDTALEAARLQEPSWPDDEYAPWVDAKRAVDPKVFRDWRFDLAEDRIRDALGLLDRPALLVTGAPARGAIVTPEVAAEAVELAPVHVSHHPMAGHSVRRDDRQGWTAAVRAFLAP